LSHLLRYPEEIAMSLLDKATNRLQTLADRERFENDLDDEMRFHLEMEAGKHEARGLAPDEARALARREFGQVDRFKDEVRDVRGVTWMDDIRRDVRFALRSLRRSPGFTLVAVLCLALGIGANAAIFSVINAVLLRPLPYADSDRLIRAYEMRGDEGKTGSVSVPNYLDWRAQNSGFQDLAAWQEGNRNLEGEGGTERIGSVEVTPNLFAILGTSTLRGRAFVPGQDEPGKGQVVVIGESLWRRRFGGDAALIGRSIRLDGQAYTVLGVMPAGFDFPPGPEVHEIWTVYQPSPALLKQRGSHFLAVAGRLKPGVSLDQASVQLKTVAARIEKMYPNEQAGRSVLLKPLKEAVVGKTRKALLVLLGAVLLVLLIACANVANLLLARAAVRRREVAVRLALGAGRARLIRQFLVESLVLAFGGALLGALIAWGSLTLLRPFAAVALPIAGDISIDARVFGFLLGVSVLSGVLFGLVPALQASREDVRDTLSDASAKSTSGGGQKRFRSALVVLEIALSLVLLVGAGLLMRGFLALSSTPSGLNPDRVLTVHLAVPDGQLNGSVPRVFQPVLEKVRHLPGVRSAGVISMLPIQDAWTNGGYQIEGRPAPKPGEAPTAEYRIASPQLFTALGIPILYGRDFTDRDGGKGSRLLIINEALARKEFPGENPVGRQIRLDKEAAHTIIGVVGSVRQAGLDIQPLPEIYFPYVQIGVEDWLGNAVLVIRTAQSPESVTGAVRQEVASVDRGVSLFDVETMDEVITRSLASRRLNLWLIGIFAGIALVLSAAGLYGVISYLVAQRTREIGVRIALGAQTLDVIGLVMGQGARLTAVGIGLGLLGALAFTRVLESLLYGVSARDPLTFVSIAGLLAAVALLATWLPARRAARVDPILAIRNE
jgi:putative ABC transport system permease protein